MRYLSFFMLALAVEKLNLKNSGKGDVRPFLKTAERVTKAVGDNEDVVFPWIYLLEDLVE